MSRNVLPYLRPSRIVTAAAVALVACLLSSSAAQAHVRVIPESTEAGGFSKLTFRVPTESDTASTVKLAITLPTEKPLVYVSAQPVPGWTVTITKAKLPQPVTLEGTTITEAPSVVTWTAEKGNGIAPGEFQEFALSAGPLPDEATELAFPAAQTYSDGKVVTWDQPQPAGEEEPEYPLPEFAVTAGQDDAITPAGTATTDPDTSKDTSDPLARGLGIAGLAVGVLGLGLGGFAATRKKVA